MSLFDTILPVRGACFGAAESNGVADCENHIDVCFGGSNELEDTSSPYNHV
jgi:hypothetical protein